MELPVVFVHGMRVSGASWTTHMERLSRPAVAPDLPGHGRRRDERFTIDGAVDAVAGAVDEVGGQALVVGHSLGGYVAIATAARHPERVAGLVVAGSTCVPGRALTTPFRVAHRVLSRLPDGGDRLSKWVFTRVLPPAVAEHVVAGEIATEVIPDVLASVQDPLADLRRYPGPVWLVNGGLDHFRAHERRFLAACANGRLIIAPRAGHYLPLTHPDAFVRLVSGLTLT